MSRKDNVYWLVRQAICIVAFFGVLHLQECMDLVLERATSSRTTGPSSAGVTSWRAGSSCRRQAAMQLSWLSTSSK